MALSWPKDDARPRARTWAWAWAAAASVAWGLGACAPSPQATLAVTPTLTSPDDPDETPASLSLSPSAPRASREQLQAVVDHQLRALIARDERALLELLLSPEDFARVCDVSEDQETLTQSKQEQFVQSDLASCQHLDLSRAQVKFWEGGQAMQPHYDCPSQMTLHTPIEVHLALEDAASLVITVQGLTLLHPSGQLRVELPPRCERVSEASPEQDPSP